MVDVVVVATAMSAGALCGWWLRGADNRERQSNNDPNEVGDVMTRLRTVAENVSINLGEHHSRMREIHTQLKNAQNQDPEHIVAAVTELLESNELIQEQLHSAEEKLEKQAQQIESHAAEARTDALTQLANRRALNDFMEECQAAYDEEQIPATVMILDVDHFKKFNDTYGHQAGDEVLRGVARVLRRHIPVETLVARYGGEEFAVVFASASYADVRAVCEQTRATIADARFRFEGMKLQVTASAGVASFVPNENVDGLIRRADAALYRSKESGRNCGFLHDGNKLRPLERRLPGEAKPDQTSEAPSEADLEKTDFAAGVSNEQVFCADVERRVAECRRGGATLSVLAAKIDELDEYEEKYGHDVARCVIRAATLFIKATMRDMDHVARFEDGSFSLMLPGADVNAAVAVAERVRNAVARCQLPERKFPPRSFTISVGVAEATSDEEADLLLDRVRDSLDAASTHGRNCSYIHDGNECKLVGAGSVTLT